MGYPPSSSGTVHIMLTSSVTPVSSSGLLGVRMESSIVGRPGGVDTPKSQIHNVM